MEASFRGIFKHYLEVKHCGGIWEGAVIPSVLCFVVVTTRTVEEAAINLVAELLIHEASCRTE